MHKVEEIQSLFREDTFGCVGPHSLSTLIGLFMLFLFDANLAPVTHIHFPR